MKQVIMTKMDSLHHKKTRVQPKPLNVDEMTIDKFINMSVDAPTINDSDDGGMPSGLNHINQLSSKGTSST
jgi:hypothetical protein